MPTQNQLQEYVTRMRTSLRFVGTILAYCARAWVIIEAAMSMPGQAISQSTIGGSIRAIDLLGRELSLIVEGDTTAVYVPPGCPISLNGDSVRLRLMQPGDD